MGPNYSIIEMVYEKRLIEEFITKLNAASYFLDGFNGRHIL